MIGLQLWLEPLLWLCGAFGTLFGFFKLVFPCIKKISETPKKLEDTIQTMNSMEQKLLVHMEAVTNSLDGIVTKIDRVEQIQVRLLHDGILDIYADAKRNGKITESSYRRALELYGMNGQDEYINRIMEELDEIHRGV